MLASETNWQWWLHRLGHIPFLCYNFLFVSRCVGFEDKNETKRRIARRLKFQLELYPKEKEEINLMKLVTNTARSAKNKQSGTYSKLVWVPWTDGSLSTGCHMKYKPCD